MNATLPETCYCILPGYGQLIQVQNGQQGYYPVRLFGEHVFGQAAITAMNRLNASLGVDWKIREAMQTGSMFGWDVPGVNPSAYEGLEEPSYGPEIMGATL